MNGSTQIGSYVGLSILKYYLITSDYLSKLLLTKLHVKSTDAGGMFSDSTIHPAGNYTFPFQFQLPPTLPTSFEGAWGNVRFFAQCTIDRPWKFDHKTKRPFTVTSHLDLNTLPDSLVSTVAFRAFSFLLECPILLS